jgi:hypothetical protein
MLLFHQLLPMRFLFFTLNCSAGLDYCEEVVTVEKRQHLIENLKKKDGALLLSTFRQ